MQPNTNDLVGIMANLLTVLAETTVGYHRTLVEGGIPADVASEMTKEFHTKLLEQLPQQKGARR